MEESKYKWSMLLQKYLDEDITPEELVELHRLKDSSKFCREQFERVTAPGYYQKSLHDVLEIDATQKWKEVKDSIFPPKPIVIWWRRNRKVVLSAAACVVIVLCAVIYSMSTKPFPAGKSVADNILPMQEPRIKGYSYILVSNEDEIRFMDHNDGVMYNSNGTIIKKEGGVIEIENVKSADVDNDKVFHLVTAPMKQQTLKLPDGSTFILDAASCISFRLNNIGKHRELRIYGQAFCDVDKRANTYCTIDLSDSVKVSVLGTTFNVRNYKNENPTVALKTGKVKLTRGSEIYNMRPGEEVVLTADKKFQLIKNVNIDAEVSWTKGELSFENKNVIQVMRKIGAFYHMPVRFADSNLPENKGYGRIPIEENVRDITSAIEDFYTVNIKVTDSLIVSNKR
jgi:transmembrane sensor